MASRNPFDLLVDDDNDDVTQLIAKLPAAAPAKKTPPASGLTVKPAPKKAPAVQDFKTERGGGRSGGRGAGHGGRAGRGFNRYLSSMDLSDDIFGASINLEDIHLNEGFKEGYDTGFASGKDDGREVGLKTGFITGEELGFYRGCIDVWKSVLRVEPTCFSARVQKNIKEMDELMSKYPILEPENESVTDMMGSLRLKFRAICATLNVKLEYTGYPKASNPNEIQF